MECLLELQGRQQQPLIWKLCYCLLSLINLVLCIPYDFKHITEAVFYINLIKELDHIVVRLH